MNKRLLVIGHPMVVGANRKVWSEVAKLSDYEVDIIIPANWKSNLIKNLEYQFDEKIDGVFSNIYPLNCYFKGNGSFYFFEMFKFWSILRQNKYDGIVLTQETWAFSLLQLFLSMKLTKNRKTKSFLWVCQNIKKQHLYFLRFFERMITSSLSAILCCCSEIEEVIRWKAIKTKCLYFPFSFDGKDYGQNIQPIPVRDRDQITLGYLGRISEEKGISLLVRLLERLNENNVDAKLIIGGGGPQEGLIDSHDKIEFLGTIPHNEAYKFYQNIDAFVLPSQTRAFWKEQFGRVIIESIASNRPVIGSSSGAIPEVLGRVGMPFVFEETSLQDLEEKTLSVLGHIRNGEINQMVKSSREKVYELFTHEKVALRFLAFLEGKVGYDDL